MFVIEKSCTSSGCDIEKRPGVPAVQVQVKRDSRLPAWCQYPSWCLGAADLKLYECFMAAGIWIRGIEFRKPQPPVGWQSIPSGLPKASALPRLFEPVALGPYRSYHEAVPAVGNVFTRVRDDLASRRWKSARSNSREIPECGGKTQASRNPVGMDRFRRPKRNLHTRGNRQQRI